MSNHPDDRSVTGQNTQPLGMGAQDDVPAAGPHDDPAGWGGGQAAVRAPDVRAPRATSSIDAGSVDGGGRPHDRELHDRGRDAEGQSALDSAVDSLAEPDNRAKLLMAIAFMTALTLLLTLGILFDHLLDDGGEPVLVDGVPCLVDEGPEGEEAVLYCQR